MLRFLKITAINIIQSAAGEIEEDELVNSNLDDFEPVDEEDDYDESEDEVVEDEDDDDDDEAAEDEEEIEHSGVNMKQNSFNQNGIEEQDTLTHAAQLADIAVREAAALGSGSIKGALAGVDSSGSN